MKRILIYMMLLMGVILPSSAKEGTEKVPSWVMLV